MNQLLAMTQINTAVDGPTLVRLGYRLDIKKGGYVSPSGSAIVYLYRKPYFGEIAPVEPNTTACGAYQRDLQNLHQRGMLVN